MSMTPSLSKSTCTVGAGAPDVTASRRVNCRVAVRGMAELNSTSSSCGPIWHAKLGCNPLLPMACSKLTNVA